MTKKLDFKISDHFWAHEVLPPEASKLDIDEMIMCITPFLRIVPEKIRKMLGKPVIMNNWRSGGENKYRGWRPLYCTIGAPRSSHKFGVAIDIEVPGMTPGEVLFWLETRQFLFPEITRYEDFELTPTWNHFDGKYTGLGEVQRIGL